MTATGHMVQDFTANERPLDYNAAPNSLVTPPWIDHDAAIGLLAHDHLKPRNPIAGEVDTGIISPFSCDTSMSIGSGHVFGLQSPTFDDIFGEHEAGSLFNFEPDTYPEASRPSAACPSTQSTQSTFTSTRQSRGQTCPGSLVSPNPGSSRLQSVGVIDMSRGENPTYERRLQTESASLLAYYTDNIYSIQFPFVLKDDHVQVGYKVGWLHYLLFRSLAISRVTAILVEAHQSLQSNHAYREPYSQFLRKARGVLTKLPTCSSVSALQDNDEISFQTTETCFCYLQILLLQASFGKYVDWASVLKEAAPYFKSLLDLFWQSTSTDTSRTSVPTAHKRAINVMVAYYVWFDILAASFYRQRSFLNVSFGELIESCADDIHIISGCETWVLTSLSQILDLDVWREELNVRKQLSMIELARRGIGILEGLKDGLSELQSRDTGIVSPESQSTSTATSLFSNTAIIYLNVVVSGPTPGLPEIHGAVSKVLRGLRGPSSFHLLPIAALPLCIAGCLAERGDRIMLLDTLVKSQGDGDIPQIVRQALRIIQECWKIRDEKGHDCDWSVGISSLQDI
ncbi:putative C6 transcription factor [Seiridium cardinale]